MVNQNENAHSAKSHCDMIAARLECGYSITSLEALHRFGCMRLASRTCDLRERDMNMVTEKIVTTNGKIVASYKLAAI